MASDLSFVKYLADQVGDACGLTYRKMFGEYALYSNGKVVALVCDNQLFVKPTEAGRTFIGDVTEAPPYPGARNSFLIGDQLDDRDWLTALIQVTEKALPAPKPKKRKQKKKNKS
jgi:TfoX/Sxy family transcriptional regulator of competence genes